VPANIPYNVYGFLKTGDQEAKQYVVDKFDFKQDNYIRRVLDNVNLNQCFYYVVIKCDDDLARNLVCRVPKGKQFVFSEKIGDRLHFKVIQFEEDDYLQHRAMFGLTLRNNHLFSGDTIEIVEEGVFRDPDDVFLFRSSRDTERDTEEVQILKKTNLELPQYLLSLKKFTDKTVIITSQGGGLHLAGTLDSALAGFNLKFRAAKIKNGSYVGVFTTEGTVFFEAHSPDYQEFVFKDINNKYPFNNLEIASGSNSKIKIDGVHYNRGAAGINVLVLNNEDGEVFDLLEVYPYNDPKLRINRLKQAF
jgi:hypothetical protein